MGPAINGNNRKCALKLKSLNIMKITKIDFESQILPSFAIFRKLCIVQSCAKKYRKFVCME